ncbi:Uncaracterized surface protein containing fasciclin (FAS1) repeats [Muriicola jejuensis]|uniref:Fasciclin domain-containing protein n=1 Tax=Muriicola jejuensis TaxID=504488 RepID=A0A6P0U781_9FLAO|nr:fasciclin domain-containing protein [Muriicola jejuensis]NER08997.1 fasciclin domain-containing protein [Muriicola jejuensis]SMP12387.1 Uncaracterized surface protein containing fasciclin (FAS1) repeats [Muriicola jejuensis]
MKTTSTLLKSFALVLALVFTGACSDDDGEPVIVDPQQNIVEIALGTPELSVLVSALQAADGNLVNLLSGDGPFTVLAPTNAAFTAFLASNGFTSLEDVPTDVLSEILLNHVISADITSSDLSSLGAGYASTNATGAGGNFISIYFNASNGVRFNNVATVTDGGADIDASNGTIHIVDAVIPIPSILQHAAANRSFDSLATALGAADGNLIDVLSGDGPFTVLAPDNAAFETFLDGTPLGNVNTAVLSQVLLNHVVGGVVTSADLVAGGAGYTNTSAEGPGMNPLSLYYNTTDGVVFNGISTVTTADIVGTNGIIHAVNTVIDIPTVVTFAAADPNFSTLVEALTTLTPGTDFVNILSRTEGSNADGINPEFTVFAPTNEAFAALDAIPGEVVLTQVLLHHVVSEANVTSGDLTPNGDTPATTLQGDGIVISLPGTGDNIADVTDGAGNTDIGIIAVDVQAGNGVIHVLNKVLLPNL